MVEDNLSTLQLEPENEQGWVNYVEHDCLAVGEPGIVKFLQEQEWIVEEVGGEEQLKRIKENPQGYIESEREKLRFPEDVGQFFEREIEAIKNNLKFHQDEPTVLQGMEEQIARLNELQSSWSQGQSETVKDYLAERQTQSVRNIAYYYLAFGSAEGVVSESLVYLNFKKLAAEAATRK